MSNQLGIKVMVCEDYQKLLEESQRALETWNDLRAEVTSSRVVGREAGDELLRLQAKFARAYAMLQHHMHHCFLCKLMAHIEGNDSEYGSDPTYSDAQYV
jgi:hypothetical protein